MKGYLLIVLVSFLLTAVLLIPASDGEIGVSYIATFVVCDLFLFVIRSLLLEMNQLKNQRNEEMSRDKIIQFKPKGDRS